MGPKTPGNGSQAEYGSDRFRFVGALGFAGPDLRRFPNRQEDNFFPTTSAFRDCAFIASQFDDRCDSVAVPVNDAVLSMNPHERRYGCVGCFARVSLMVELFPQFVRNDCGAVLGLKPCQ